MIVFVLVFVVLTVALPAAGEVWSHGDDNVFNRSRREVVVIAEPYLEGLQGRLAEAKEQFVWLSALIGVAVALLNLLARLIDRFLR